MACAPSDAGGEPGAGGPRAVSGEGAFSGALGGGARQRSGVARSAIGEIKQLGARSVDAMVIELGAGTGTLTGQLARAGVGPVAVEESTDRIGQLRRSLPGVSTVRSGREALPFRDAGVDLVVTQTTELPWGECARVVRPGGRLVVVLADHSSGEPQHPLLPEDHARVDFEVETDRHLEEPSRDGVPVRTRLVVLRRVDGAVARDRGER